MVEIQNWIIKNNINMVQFFIPASSGTNKINNDLIDPTKLKPTY